MLQVGDWVRVVYPRKADVPADPHHGRKGRVVLVMMAVSQKPGSVPLVEVAFADGLQQTYYPDQLVPAEFEAPPAASGEIGILLERGRQVRARILAVEAATARAIGEIRERAWQSFLLDAPRDLGPLAPFLPRPRTPLLDFAIERGEVPLVLDVPGVGLVGRFFRSFVGGWHAVRFSFGDWAALPSRSCRGHAVDTSQWEWFSSIEEALARAEEMAGAGANGSVSVSAAVAARRSDAGVNCEGA